MQLSLYKVQQKHVLLHEDLHRRFSRFVNEFQLILDQKYESIFIRKMRSATPFIIQGGSTKTCSTLQALHPQLSCFSTLFSVDFG